MVLSPLLDCVAARAAETLASYGRARNELSAALDTNGGMAKLRALESISLRWDGELVHRNQSARPDPPYQRTENTGRLLVDFKHNRMMAENIGSFPLGFYWGNRLIAAGGKAYILNLVENRFTSLSDSQLSTTKRLYLTRLPHSLLLEAFDQAAQLRYVGTATYENQPQQLISYATKDGQVITLFLDEKTHLVSKAEWLQTDFTAGDAIVSVQFHGYHTVAGVYFPERSTVTVAGEVTVENRFHDIAINNPLEDALFKAPTDLPEIGKPIVTEPYTKLSDTSAVIHTSSGYNVLVVAFTDYTVVVEAPISDALSKDVMTRVSEIFPGKPIRYVAVTHFHDDHAGGARGYMVAGVTLVTTPGNVKFFGRLRQRQGTISNDAVVPNQAAIEIVENQKRVFTDGLHTLELIDIGRGPHAQEMLIAYLPKERIVFQGDLWNRSPDGFARPANLASAHFARRLKELNLSVERVEGVHGPSGSIDEFNLAVLQFENEGKSSKGDR